MLWRSATHFWEKMKGHPEHKLGECERSWWKRAASHLIVVNCLIEEIERSIGI
jgi:hypothetical protein